ncbi:hypothetical protein RA19_04225 [Leisingera sp. ANG-M1]|nr:hypothetical protein RA19_04225 [Leisingera sp. ANG-M1]
MRHCTRLTFPDEDGIPANDGPAGMLTAFGPGEDALQEEGRGAYLFDTGLDSTSRTSAAAPPDRTAQRLQAMTDAAWAEPAASSLFRALYPLCKENRTGNSGH